MYNGTIIWYWPKGVEWWCLFLRGLGANDRRVRWKVAAAYCRVHVMSVTLSPTAISLPTAIAQVSTLLSTMGLICQFMVC